MAERALALGATEPNPCPCGYAHDLKVEELNFADLGGAEDWSYYVRCPGCTKRGRYGDAPWQAIDRWNFDNPKGAT